MSADRLDLRRGEFSERSPTDTAALLTRSDATDTATPWADIPLDVLRSELARRQAAGDERPSCGSRDGKNSYNTPAHVAALFLILALSTLGESINPPDASVLAAERAST